MAEELKLPHTSRQFNPIAPDKRQIPTQFLRTHRSFDPVQRDVTPLRGSADSRRCRPWADAHG
jgi:hypothetical protein